MGDSSAFIFECEACAKSMEVNGSMREALLEQGCVICGASVSPKAFEDR